MTHTLRCGYPVAAGTPTDDPTVLAHVRDQARRVAGWRQCEVVSDPRHVETTEARHPGWVTHVFECETTEPVFDDR